MIQLILRFIIAALVFCSATIGLSAQQKYYESWYFGSRLGVDFRTDPISPIAGSTAALEGCSSISNPATGALMFYTDGATVWNRNNGAMPNGTDLFGNLSCTQSSLIVPHPGDPFLYYIFTQDGTTVGAPRRPQGYGLRYSIVDMRARGGFGDVVEKNTLVLSTASEKLTAVRHPDGCGYWIITHELYNDKFYAWLLTRDGLSAPVISRTGKNYAAVEAGYLKASPNGEWLFAAGSFINYNGFNGELFPFDALTGVVGPRTTYLPSGYGASFSPNNRFLYASRADSLIQYDLSVAPNDIAGTATLLNFPNPNLMLYGMQIGPNGKVYVIEGPVYQGFLPVNMKLNVINKPNVAGFAAGYGSLYNYSSVQFFAGLPNCIDGYLGETEVGNHHEDPPVILPKDTIVCAGTPVQLSVRGGYWYKWFETQDIDCDTCQHVLVTPEETTTYTVVVYGAGACRGFDTVSVTVQVKEIEVDAGPDTTICFGGSVQLQASGGTRYQWLPDKDLSCDQCSDPIASPPTTTTYFVQISDNRGCSRIDSITVFVTDKSPVRIAPRDTVLGCGESLTLRAPGGKEYRWFPDPTLSCDDCPEPVATPTERTTYYLDVVDSTGCSVLDSIVVDISKENVRAAKDTTICLGRSVQLSATGRKEYRWTPTEGLSCDDCPNPVATPLQTTSYVVEGTTNGLCRDYDTVTVTVHDVSKVDAGADTTICLGDSVQLQASGGVDYFWTSSTLSGVYRPDPIAFPTTTTTYHVRITNEYGCIIWDSVTVTVENNGSVLAAGDTAFCAGGTAQLFAEGAASYRWTPTIGLSCEDCPDPQATPTETTTYYVLGSNTNGGCPALDSVIVVVYDFPVAEAGEGGAICSGESIELQASGGARYRWDASMDLSCEDCPDPTVQPTETTMYYVTVWNAEGCSSRDSVEVVVHPDLVVVAGEVETICSGESVALRAEGGVRWEWSPAEGLSCTDCPNPIASPSTTTMYRVRAWNAEGCEAEDSVEVKVREESGVIRLRIGRNYRGATGEELVLPIEVVEGFGDTDISELELRVEYNASMMRLDKESFARLLVGTALEGWSVEIQGYTHKDILLRFVAPAGETLSATNPFLLFQLQLYLSSERGSELPFRVDSDSKCFTIETTPGYAEVDSICGLGFRLIETTLTKYVAPVTYPNPAHDRMQFEFGLGLDGRAVLEVFDVQGRRVGLLVDSELASGLYSVEWDVREVESGQYWYRLRSGDWVKTGQVRVQK